MNDILGIMDSAITFINHLWSFTIIDNITLGSIVIYGVVISILILTIKYAVIQKNSD